MPNRKPTIYDIAGRSGASPSTVSAVLSGAWASRRISEGTAQHVAKIAEELGYAINMQARGLRKARSGLVGMIIPEHENRFFSSMGQSFDTMARERGLCPVIASTLRSPQEEKRIVETLISYAIDALFIAGATDQKQLGRICTAASLKHIYIDLPGRDAPSVITDNFKGAQMLTRRIIAEMPGHIKGPRAKPCLVGGVTGDHATERRVAAFRQTVAEWGAPPDDCQILQCGYAPEQAAKAIADLCQRIGGLPACLFVNSLTTFEGVMSHFATLPASAFKDSAIGCFDYDPFVGFMHFPVHMVRQNTGQMIAKAYELLDDNVFGSEVHEIEPLLIEPRTVSGRVFGGVG